jgi:hypothetical protein
VITAARDTRSTAHSAATRSGDDCDGSRLLLPTGLEVAEADDGAAGVGAADGKDEEGALPQPTTVKKSTSADTDHEGKLMNCIIFDTLVLSHSYAERLGKPDPANHVSISKNRSAAAPVEQRC